MTDPGTQADRTPARHSSARKYYAIARARLDRVRPTRLPVIELLFAVAAIVAVGTILTLGRNLTFVGDEWVFLNNRLGWSADVLLRPHNVHWVSGLLLLWKPLLSTIGVESYVPYLALLATLHVVCAVAVFRLISLQAGRAIALCASVVFLFLGTAGEDLFWAFQVGFVGAVAAGAWALFVILRKPAHSRAELAVIATLLIVSVATSGPGLTFLGAAFALAIVLPSRRYLLKPLAIVIAVYLLWLVAFGYNAFGDRVGRSLASPTELLEYVRKGVFAAVESVSGLGPEVAVVLAVLLVGASVINALGRSPLIEAAWVGTAGLLLSYATSGLVRVADYGSDFATISRYAYAPAVFTLLAAAAWLGRVRRRNNDLRLVTPIVVLTAVSLVHNLTALKQWADVFQDRAYETRAYVDLVLSDDAYPDMTHPIPRLNNIQRPRLEPLLEAYGYRAHLASLAGDPVPDEVRQRVLFEQISPRLTIEDGASAPGSPAQQVGLRWADLDVHEVNGCIEIQPTGPDPQLLMKMRASDAVWISGRPEDRVEVFMSSSDTFYGSAMMTVELGPIASVELQIPPQMPTGALNVRLDPDLAGPTVVCASGTNLE